MKKKKYKYVCFITTVYALLVYLLHANLDQIGSTLFVLSDTFPKIVGDRLPTHFFLKEEINKKNKLVRFFYNHPKIAWIYYKLVLSKIFKNVDKEYKLYAQDHLYFSSSIIGNHDYTLIEDAKDFFSQAIINLHPLSPPSTLYQRLYGESHRRTIGRNNKCVSLLSTSANVAKELQMKKNIIIDIHQEWENAPIEKKDFIKEIFDIQEETIEQLKKYELLLFTQNIYFYSVFSKEEQAGLYRRIVEKYPGQKVLIKPHPLDDIVYEDYIDDVDIWRSETPIPSQLLSLCGVRFKKYVTIFSTAVNDLESNANIDWYGTECDERIMRCFGKVPSPSNVKVCKL